MIINERKTENNIKVKGFGYKIFYNGEKITYKRLIKKRDYNISQIAFYKKYYMELKHPSAAGEKYINVITCRYYDADKNELFRLSFKDRYAKELFNKLISIGVNKLDNEFIKC